MAGGSRKVSPMIQDGRSRWSGSVQVRSRNSKVTRWYAHNTRRAKVVCTHTLWLRVRIEKGIGAAGNASRTGTRVAHIAARDAERKENACVFESQRSEPGGARAGPSARRYGGDAALRSSPPSRSQMAPLTPPGRSPRLGFSGEGGAGWLATGACSQRAPRPK